MIKVRHPSFTPTLEVGVVVVVCVGVSLNLKFNKKQNYIPQHCSKCSHLIQFFSKMDK